MVYADGVLGSEVLGPNEDELSVQSVLAAGDCLLVAAVPGSGFRAVNKIKGEH